MRALSSPVLKWGFSVEAPVAPPPLRGVYIPLLSYHRWETSPGTAAIFSMSRLKKKKKNPPPRAVAQARAASSCIPPLWVPW